MPADDIRIHTAVNEICVQFHAVLPLKIADSEGAYGVLITYWYDIVPSIVFHQCVYDSHLRYLIQPHC